MSWKSKVSGTFGDQDLKFAGHELDTERALDLLKECYKSNVPLQEVLDEVERYLRSKKANDKLIKTQVDKVRDKFSGWLS